MTCIRVHGHDGLRGLVDWLGAPGNTISICSSNACPGQDGCIASFFTLLDHGHIIFWFSCNMLIALFRLLVVYLDDLLQELLSRPASCLRWLVEGFGVLDFLGQRLERRAEVVS